MKIISVTNQLMLSHLADNDEEIVGKISGDALTSLSDPNSINQIVSFKKGSDCCFCSLLDVMDFMSKGNPVPSNASLEKPNDVIAQAIKEAEDAIVFVHRTQESETTKRVMRALKKRFPDLDTTASHTVVNGKALTVLFPPLIPDSPVTKRASLANRIYLLSIQFFEWSARLIIDPLISLGLSLYSFVQPDEAEYQRMRLNMTKNHAWISMRHNVYVNLV